MSKKKKSAVKKRRAPKVRKKRSIVKSNVVEYLVKKKMLQVELADLCKVDRQHMSKICQNEKKHISLEMAMKIAKALGEPVEKVFTLE